METDEERKARLKKMVATTQLRLALETEDERRARLEYLSDNPIYILNNLYLILKVLYHRQCQYTQANEYHFDGANSIETTNH